MGCAGGLYCAGAFSGRLRTCDFFFAMGVLKQTDAYKTGADARKKIRR